MNAETQNNHILALVDAGRSVIPIAEGKKNPHGILGKTHDLLTRRPTREEAERWIAAGVSSWALAGGAVSGNLTTLDFDEKHYPGLYDLWYAKLADNQKAVVDTLPRNSTRNRGTHLRCRTKTPQPTVKLARRVEFNKETKKDEIVTTAETKAEGGYALIPPSAGYTMVQGDLTDIPVVSDEMYEELINILRTFNEVEDAPATEYEWKPGDSIATDRPGDRFNARATWEEILTPHGWVQELENRWRRPGKKAGDGISATTDHAGVPMLYVFSSSAAPFTANKGVSKFHAFALLNHSGDFKAAARAAAEMYPSDPLSDGTAASIETIEEMLRQIPSDTPKVKLMGVLGPILHKLVVIDRITAEMFILNNIKDYFALTKEEARKYVPHLKDLKAKSVRASKKAKEERERLPLIFDRDIDFQEAYDAVSGIGIVDKDVFKLTTAAVISSRLRLNPPLWFFLIGVPSSFKTELVGLYDLDGVYTLDTLTENAFASGYVPPDGSETQDLLPLLDNKAFIIKDLNTLFSMNEEMVKKILGDLTSIFDGKFQKFTATRGMIEYNALFSMIGCITPSILIKHYNYATQLGPRFLFLRLPELTEEELQGGLKKSWTGEKRAEKIIAARQIVSSYCAQLIKQVKGHQTEPETEEVQESINHIALFICKARGIAITGTSTFKNEAGTEIEYQEIKDWQIEQPWRILNQLKALLRILSLINGKNTVDETEIKIIRPIVMSTMPVDRAEIIAILASESGLSAKTISKKIKKSPKTARRTMKVLETLGIVDCYKDPSYHTASTAPWLYFIREEFAPILGAPVPSPECLSQSKSVLGDTETDDVEDAGDSDDVIPPETEMSAPPQKPAQQVVSSGYKYITSVAELKEVLSLLITAQKIGLDIETTGLDPLTCKMRLVQLATDAGAVIVDTYCVDVKELQPLFDSGTTLIGHNLKFDLQFLVHAGITIGDSVSFFDTLLADQVLRGSRIPRTLKVVVEEYLGTILDKTEQTAQWGGKLTPEMLTYAAQDAAIMLPLHECISTLLAANSLSEVATLENEALPFIVQLELAGVPIQSNQWQALTKGAKTECTKLEAELNGIAGKAINWNSPKQITAVLKDQGVVVASTKESALSAHSGHVLVSTLLKYREQSKYLTTYGEKFLRHVHKATGRIHPNFRQIGADSGRMACSAPNMQNIPRKREYRACVAPKDGRVLVKADYSQIELRIAAEISGDKRLIEAYKAGQDIHTLTAQLIMGKGTPTKEDRQAAKAINFGLIYGMGAPRLKDYAKNTYGVVLTDTEAVTFRNKFFAAYQGLRKWHLSQPEGVRTMKTLSGRKRFKVERFTEKLNTPVQGTGADGLKAALGLLWQERTKFPTAQPVLVVHDEVVMECDAADAPLVGDWLKDCMKRGMERFVKTMPVEVEVTIAPTWAK
jgi:DNA polymerase-1